MLVICFSVVFYAPIIPAITIVGIITGIIMYWVLKIVILRRNAVKKQVDSKLLIYAVRILKLGILLNAAASFGFLWAVFDEFSYPTLVGLIIAIIYCFTPIRTFIIKKYVDKVDRDEEGEDYYKYEKTFLHYDVHNPLTRAQGIQRLHGNSLKNSIRRAILQKLENRAREAGVKELYNLSQDSLGLRDLDLLMYAKDRQFMTQHQRPSHSNSSSSPSRAKH